MKLGYCYLRTTNEVAKFSLNVDEDILKLIMKSYEEDITKMVNNGEFDKTFEVFDEWKKLNDLLQESKEVEENE